LNSNFKKRKGFNMKKPLIIGIMGGGKATQEDEKVAYRLG